MKPLDYFSQPEIIIDAEKIARELQVQNLPDHKERKKHRIAGAGLLEMIKEVAARDGSIIRIEKEDVKKVNSIFEKMNQRDLMMFPFVCPGTVFKASESDYKTLLLQMYMDFLLWKGFQKKLSWAQEIVEKQGDIDVNGYVKTKYEGEFFMSMAIKFLSPEQIDNEWVRIMMLRLHDLDAIIEQRLQTKEREILEAERKFFKNKNHPVTRLFIINDAVNEKPELDIPYLDTLLCYMGGVFVPNINLANIENTSEDPDEDNSNGLGPLWVEWIKARIHLLRDDDSEVGKIFKHIFDIHAYSPIFTKEGMLSAEAQKKLPSILQTTLIEAAEKHRVDKKTVKAAQQVFSAKVVDTLFSPTKQVEQPRPAPEVTFDIHNLLNITITGLPEDTKRIELRIYNKKGKVVGFGEYECGEGSIPGELSLADIGWKNISISATNPLILGSEFQGLKEKEQYSFGITGLGSNGKIAEGRTQSYTIPERRQSGGEVAGLTNTHSGIVTEVLRRATGSAKATPPKPTTTDTPADPTSSIPQPAKNPKDEEREFLELAITEFFEQKDKEELQAIFTSTVQWDEDHQTITLSLGVEELTEYGYEPALLELADYAPLLQWSAQLEEGRWKTSPETPKTIKTVIPEIHVHILKVKEREQERDREQQINKELEELGLPVSRNRSSEKLRKDLEAIIKKRGGIKTERLHAKILESGVRENGYRFFCNNKSISLAKKQGETTQDEWSVVYNWMDDSWKITRLDENLIFQERVKNALLQFLVDVNEEDTEDILEEDTEDILIEETDPEYHEKLENGLRERLEKCQASLFIRFQGQAIFIPDVSVKNYTEKIQEIRKKYGDISIFVVYRTYSYAFYDEEFRTGQDETYDRCIKNHLELIQARCCATLAQKSSFKENTSTPEGVTTQERDAFTNGVANLCREFFFKRDPFNTEDMGEFITHIHQEGTEKEKQEVLYSGVREALFGNNRNVDDINPDICRTFFFKKDPNNLDDVADFLYFLQKRGTNQKERPGEKHVGIVYSSPVIGPISDIPKILAKRKEKRRAKKKK